jgi:hypothetical protein
MRQPGSVRQQRGMSTLALLAAIGLIGLAITCGLKMVPAYLDYWTLKGIFESVEADPSLSRMSPKDIAGTLQRRLDINSIRGFNSKEAVSIRKEEGQLFIEFYYEVRQELFANVDVVMKFEHNYSTSAAEE